MRRALATAAITATALLAGSTATAVADEPAPVAEPPAEFAPPAPAPVTDVASAEAFISRYAARNAPRFLGASRRRVRVFDVQARCLEHPVIADRFGCVFTLRAAVIRRSHGWDGYHGKAPEAQAAGKRRRVRVRNFGCLGAARVIGGPSVEPQVSLRLLECARVPRGDYDAPAPTV